MYIAAQKLEQNIAEYILYIWQLEDFLRGCNLDINCVQEKLIDTANLSDEDKKEVRNWYADFISKIKLEGKEKVGHINEINEIIVELNYLHSTLMNLLGDERYKGIVKNAIPYLNEFKSKAQIADKSDIEIALQALYSKLLLKLNQKKISESSEEAFSAFAKMLGYLSVKYKLMKAGELA